LLQPQKTSPSLWLTHLEPGHRRPGLACANAGVGIVLMSHAAPALASAAFLAKSRLDMVRGAANKGLSNIPASSS
jgi:hypothetical protein